MRTLTARPIQVRAGDQILNGDLRVPAAARGVIVFAHPSGHSRFSTRNRLVAEYLDAHGFATLLLDLLTEAEDAVDVVTGRYRFDVERLGARVAAAVDWLEMRPLLRDLAIGCFGASTGAAAALIASADRPAAIKAVVSRSGRPDLAGPALARVLAPTLLIVGGDDHPLIGANRLAQVQLRAPVEVAIVAGATHLFAEPGALDRVARLAGGWFGRYLTAGVTGA